MILGKIGSALSNHFWMFTTFELVVGIAQGGISLVLPVIATELVGPNYKTMVGSWIGFFHTFSICFMAIQGWLVLNWRHFLLITSAPYLILLASYKYVLILIYHITIFNTFFPNDDASNFFELILEFLE